MNLVICGTTWPAIYETIARFGAAQIITDPGWSEASSESFQIYARRATFENGNDAIVLDASKLVIDQVGKLMIGMVGAGRATHVDLPGADLFRSVKEAIQGIFEAKEATSLKEKLRFGASTGTPEMVGLQISLMPLRGGKSTGMKAVRVCDLSIWAQTYLNATRWQSGRDRARTNGKALEQHRTDRNRPG